LVEARQKRQLNPEQRAAVVERLKKFRFEKDSTADSGRTSGGLSAV
jgi:hypothetical protein